MKRFIAWLIDPNGFEKILEIILFIFLCIAAVIKVSMRSWDALIFVLLAFSMAPFVKIPNKHKRMIMCLGIIYIFLTGVL